MHIDDRAGCARGSPRRLSRWRAGSGWLRLLTRITVAPTIGTRGWWSSCWARESSTPHTETLSTGPDSGLLRREAADVHAHIRTERRSCSSARARCWAFTALDSRLAARIAAACCSWNVAATPPKVHNDAYERPSAPAARPCRWPLPAAAAVRAAADIGLQAVQAEECGGER